MAKRARRHSKSQPSPHRRASSRPRYPRAARCRTLRGVTQHHRGGASSRPRTARPTRRGPLPAQRREAASHDDPGAVILARQLVHECLFVGQALEPLILRQILQLCNCIPHQIVNLVSDHHLGLRANRQILPYYNLLSLPRGHMCLPDISKMPSHILCFVQDANNLHRIA